MSSDSPSGDEAVERELKQARQALADAEGAFEANLSDSVIVNRCYYACFHAVQAVLYDRGLDPQSHAGVLSLFGSEVVTVGEATREQGRFLNELSDMRQQADYGPKPVDVDADALLAKTGEFLDELSAVAGVEPE